MCRVEQNRPMNVRENTAREAHMQARLKPRASRIAYDMTFACDRLRLNGGSIVAWLHDIRETSTWTKQQ
jgi:hypothetical protein